MSLPWGEDEGRIEVGIQEHRNQPVFATGALGLYKRSPRLKFNLDFQWVKTIVGDYP